jgi:hypothetical protein
MLEKPEHDSARELMAIEQLRQALVCTRKVAYIERSEVDVDSVMNLVDTRANKVSEKL